jgi:phosphate transport system substrate-binding protein
MNRNMMIVIGVIAVIVVAAVGAVVLMNDDQPQGRTKITEQGSDTMLELMTKLAESFYDNQTAAQVDITGGGSGVGIEALIKGNVDIAQASRAMKSSEIAAAKENGTNPVEFSVAIDGIAIIVNQGNAVSNLTMDQLRGIYNGTLTNWNQVGGVDLVITPYGRQSTSGTYQYFKETVMKNENFSSSVSQETGNAAIAVKVQNTPGGVGYVGIGYAEESTGTSMVALKANDTSTAYMPTDSAAVYSKSYPLSRYLYLYTDGTPQGAEKQWLQYVLSDEGQSIVAQEGFYKLDQVTLDAQRAKLNA